jgi:hypothetical protein
MKTTIKFAFMFALLLTAVGCASQQVKQPTDETIYVLTLPGLGALLVSDIERHADGSICFQPVGEANRGCVKHSMYMLSVKPTE